MRALQAADRGASSANNRCGEETPNGFELGERVATGGDDRICRSRVPRSHPEDENGRLAAPPAHLPPRAPARRVPQAGDRCASSDGETNVDGDARGARVAPLDPARAWQEGKGRR